MESSRTSFASRTSSRTDFEVLGLGLEASSPRKLACPRLEDSTFFELLKFCGALEKFFGKRFFVEIAWKIFVKTFFFFRRALALVSLVLGLEHTCPWPRECLSSERLSLALASDFFCVLGLGLEPCVLDSTSVIVRGGVGLEDVLKNTFWSPWPWPRRSSPWSWPRGLKSSKIALSSARGQHFFWIVEIL